MKVNRYLLANFWLLFLLTPSFSNAQWYNPDKVNEKAKKIYESAYDLAINGRYQASIEALNKALLTEPKYVEVYLSRAGIYANLKKYALSVSDFKKAFELDSVFAETYYLPYSISLAGIGEFDKALLAVNIFLSNPNLNQQSIKAGLYRKSTYDFAIDYNKRHTNTSYHFQPLNVGDSINSNSLEYFPSLTIDGKKMIFTRRVNNDEDFYESFQINGVWSKAKPVEGRINTNFNEGAQTISQDGQCLIFTGCNYPEGQGSCDLYIAYKKKNGDWTEPENLGSIINTDQWESCPTLSPNKKDLYFSSNRIGGLGGKDIWVSHKNANGKWSTPENLGPTINTKGDESCPFIHADNQTLYFNSNGHPGYGMTDLFLTKKLNDSSWSTPENLGYPINTIDDEGSMIIAADGKTSYYASDRENDERGLDIYSFELRKDIQSKKTIWISGKVIDKKTNMGLPSTVELYDADSTTNISKTSIQTDEDGNYMITLPLGKNYALHVSRKGYLFYSDYFSLLQDALDSFFIRNILLDPIATGKKLILKNIFFDNNQYNLKKTSGEELEKVLVLLQENPSVRLEIIGYTDNTGSKLQNTNLSMNRALSVMNYLISKGIDKKRLSAKGMGEANPIDTNETEEGKSNNRRTEINIL